MPEPVTHNHLERLVEAFAAQAFSRNTLVELALLAASLVLGLLLARSLRARAAAQPVRWEFGQGGFERVGSPLMALILVFASKTALHRWQQTPVLDVAASLLVALAVIRFAVYVLRRILPDGAFLRGSERSITWVMWMGAALYLTGLLPEIASALEAVAVTVGKQRISLLLVIQAVVSVAVTLAVAMWIARIVEHRVIAREDVEMSTRVVVAKLVRAVAFLAAILIALPLVGIDLTALSVFGGALGVGLGLGLQKIASNYVSGFIILLDRSVRIGDLLTVDGRHGVVREIANRYTVVRSGDGTESIIPNETLITQSVTNHSFSTRQGQVKAPLIVAIDADLDLVTGVLLEAAAADPGVSKDPAPAVVITRVSETGIELELVAWIPDALVGAGGPRSSLYRRILDGFKERKLPLPLPPRQMRVFAALETPENAPISRT